MSKLFDLAERMRGVESSPTVRLNAMAQEMIRAGKDVINLTAGETDFATSDKIQEAAIKAMHEGHTRYTSPHGIPELRKATAAWFKKEFQLDYEMKQITVTAGVKQGIFHLILATVSAGDEVLIPAPYWVSYPEMVRLAGGTPVILPYGEHFSLDPTILKKHINDKTRLLLLNSPNNPAGSMYTRENLEAIAQVVAGTQVLVAADEIYSSLVYDGAEFVPFAGLSADAYHRTITFNGLSKSHAMTGWRVGFAAGNAQIIDAMGILQGQSSTHITSFVQYAAIEALTQTAQEFAPRLVSMQERRDFCLTQLKKIPHVNIETPKGAFYLFPDMSYYSARLGGGSELLAEYLLKEAGIAIVPGKPFGDDKCIRISFAKDLKSLEKAFERISAALQKIHT